MADFRTHISVSTAVGVAYGAAGHWLLGLPPSTAILAGGLCSVSGMLPDIDSDSGIPQRESIAFAAAVIPMLSVDRLVHMELSTEAIALIGASLYLFIRFGVGWFIRAYTVHRGMWHSIPAGLIAGLAAFIICSGPDAGVRMYKAGGVMMGFFSHLMLDEIYSIEFYWGLPRLKRSFGTALKWWGDNSWANFSTYSKLAVLALVAVGDPLLMEHFGFHENPTHKVANEMVDQLRAQGEKLLR